MDAIFLSTVFLGLAMCIFSFIIVDRSCPRDVNLKRESITEHETREEVTLEYSEFRLCAWPGCHMDISHRRKEAKHCLNHSGEGWMSSQDSTAILPVGSERGVSGELLTRSR